MDKVQVIDQRGKKTKEISLPEGIFSFPVKEHLLYESVVNFRANQRRGTASTKTRGEVSGSTRKPWRQKGTGRARVGTVRNPLWRKGGTVFGPRPKNYSYALPKKARLNAMRSALSLKNSEKRILVLEAFSLEDAKTKTARQVLRELQLDSALIVDTSFNRNLFLALRNIPGVKVVDPRELNVYDVLNHDWLVLTKQALDSLAERLQP